MLMLLWHLSMCDLEKANFLAKSTAQTSQQVGDHEFKQVVYTISVVSNVEKVT